MNRAQAVKSIFMLPFLGGALIQSISKPKMLTPVVKWNPKYTLIEDRGDFMIYDIELNQDVVEWMQKHKIELK